MSLATSASVVGAQGSWGVAETERAAGLECEGPGGGLLKHVTGPRPRRVGSQEAHRHQSGLSMPLCVRLVNCSPRFLYNLDTQLDYISQTVLQ